MRANKIEEQLPLPPPTFCLLIFKANMVEIIIIIIIIIISNLFSPVSY